MADEQKEVADAGGEKKPADGQKDEQKSKLTFSEEQQAFINNLVDSVYEKAYAKAEKVWTPQIETLRKDLEAVKASSKPADSEKKPAAEADDKKAAKKKDGEVDVQAILARLDEVTKVAEDLKTEKNAAEQRARENEQRSKEARIKDEFVRAAEKVGFFDTMDVFGLTKHEIDVDEHGEVVIMNPKTKQPRLTTDGNMTLEQFLSDFAKQKPHMVRAKNVEGGTGSGESRTTDTKEKKETVDYATMPKDAFMNLTNTVIGKQYTHRK